MRQPAPRAAPGCGMRAVPRRTRRGSRPRASACGRRPLCRRTSRSAEAVATSPVSLDAAAAGRGFHFTQDGPHGATRSRPRHVPSGRRAPGSPRPRWCLGPCVSCVSSGARAALCHATWSRRRSPPLLMRVLATAIRCHAPRSPGVSRLCRARGADVRRGRSPALRRCGRIASSPHYRTWPWGARPLPRLTLAQARRCRARRKRCGAACTRAS